MGGTINRWPIADAWRAAAQVTAAAYGVQPDAIMAPSRGRGPKPPEAVQAPKKMAVHLAVIMAGCDYAALGRHVGLHKDTVSSHCAAMRRVCAEDHQLDVLALALEASAAALLTLTVGPDPRTAAMPRSPAQMVRILRRHIETVLDDVDRRMNGGGHPTPSDRTADFLENNATVIALPATRSRP